MYYDNNIYSLNTHIPCRTVFRNIRPTLPSVLSGFRGRHADGESLQRSVTDIPPNVTFPEPTDRNQLADDCGRCPALVEGRTRISWGVGSVDATLFVVGEAPGAGDPDADRWRGGNHTGMAYTSRHSGRRVRALFSSLGYTPGELYFTNAVKCFPSDGGGSNREPTETERSNCRPYLLEEIETIEPTCVVPTGRHATESLLSAAGRSLEGFLETVLQPIETDRLPPILPILHPSYQDVWVDRLGYDPDGYERAIGEALTELGAAPESGSRPG